MRNHGCHSSRRWMHAFCSLLCIWKCRLRITSISLHFHTRRSQLNLEIRGRWSTFIIDIQGNRAVGAGIVRAQYP
ncbi:hypothetical protein DFJ58DRAFT_790927 [Suillus subalutaceus]|uniref:uncharacterized protein n=1 Tax=Suillus subalutaceus TaxID=48586 RepID=UPI001B87B46C|nr:uncharacterized protein DFJ58DRAFT_790927 [Suillus subalutaceus]KAG1852427.1 hypothetical protein DFJ58DRAFT_790927 [Suillus subalutaceus]